MNDNRCIFCGEIIPEGRQVCPTCEKKLTKNTDRTERREEHDVQIHGLRKATTEATPAVQQIHRRDVHSEGDQAIRDGSQVLLSKGIPPSGKTRGSSHR